MVSVGDESFHCLEHAVLEGLAVLILLVERLVTSSHGYHLFFDNLCQYFVGGLLVWISPCWLELTLCKGHIFRLSYSDSFTSMTGWTIFTTATIPTFRDEFTITRIIGIIYGFSISMTNLTVASTTTISANFPL